MTKEKILARPSGVREPIVKPGVSVQVLSPKPSAPGANSFIINRMEQIEITVKFSEEMKTETVIPGKTLFFDPEADLLKPSWPDKKTMKLTTAKKWNEIPHTSHPDFNFSIRLIGVDKGNGVVKSMKGQVLDGDYNGLAGGDYKMGFTIPG